MKPISRILAFVWLIAALLSCCEGQSICTNTWCTNSQLVSSSGSSLKIANAIFGVTSSFEYVISGTPSAMSIVLKGCKNGGTCDTLNTFTGTSSGIAEPTVSTVYDYFTITPTWTGSNITVQINTTVTTARSGGSGGGGSVSSVYGRTGAVTAQSGDYTAAQVSAIPSTSAPSGTIVGTSDTQTLTNKTVDGVSPATFAFLDPTSSVQTQLNAKAPLASPSFTGTVTVPVTGSTQCLHVNTSGNVSGTGSDCGSGGSAAFSALTGSTNTTAAMVVGTGASLGASGSGTIAATSVPAAGLGAGTLSNNTSGTASNLSGTPALPNGTTATTQTGSDNTTKVATTAFVQSAVSGAGGITGLTTNTVPKATSSTGIGNSSISDDGTNVTVTEPLIIGGSNGQGKLTQGTAPTTAAGFDWLYADSTALRLKMMNNGGSADTILGAATTDTLTNKTFDTAGSGNSFSINGVAATANTGTGSVVRATSPTLVTPVLGVATATTVNKVTLTAPATGSTLTIADGKTLAANNSLTLAGTDSTTMTFPGTSDTVVTLGATQTLTNKTLTTAALGSSTATTQSAKDNSTKVATTAYVDAPTPLTAGTSVTLSAPRQYFVCTTTCTITVPVPAAGYEFCVMNDDNVSTVITLSAIGSSARYENTARTAYGTAGTGTFVSGGAAGDKVCLLGRDSTHYLTSAFNGTWVAN